MQRFMKKILYCLITIMTLLLVGCAKTGTTDTFRFQVREIELTVGETKTLDLILGDFDKSSEIICEQIDKTDDSGVLEVLSVGDASVTVKAEKVGECIFKAYLKEKSNVSDTITVTISNNKVDLIKVSSDHENASGIIEIYIDESVKLNVFFSPVNDNIKLAYSSSNENVLTVSSDGTITGVSKGRAVIDVYEENDPSFKVSKTVDVKYIETAKLEVVLTDNMSVDENGNITLNMTVGETCSFEVKAYDKDGQTDTTDPTRTAKSSNRKLSVTGGENITVTATGTGSYKVTVSVGSCEISIAVKVVEAEA